MEHKYVLVLEVDNSSAVYGLFDTLVGAKQYAQFAQGKTKLEWNRLGLPIAEVTETVRWVVTSAPVNPPMPQEVNA